MSGTDSDYVVIYKILMACKGKWNHRYVNQPQGIDRLGAWGNASSAPCLYEFVSW